MDIIGDEVHKNSLQIQYSPTETIKIYTDWANYYLEKCPKKRHLVTDIQRDLSDGVLLADIIFAVANQKVGSIHTKPKSSSQMIENINNCLQFLSNIGVSTDGLSAKDIRDGNLKSILSLFFNLSRYKQQQKSLHQKEHSSRSKHQQGHQANVMQQRGSNLDTTKSTVNGGNLPTNRRNGDDSNVTNTAPDSTVSCRIPNAKGSNHVKKEVNGLGSPSLSLPRKSGMVKKPGPTSGIPCSPLTTPRTRENQRAASSQPHPPPPQSTANSNARRAHSAERLAGQRIAPPGQLLPPSSKRSDLGKKTPTHSSVSYHQQHGSNSSSGKNSSGMLKKLFSSGSKDKSKQHTGQHNSGQHLPSSTGAANHSNSHPAAQVTSLGRTSGLSQPGYHHHSSLSGASQSHSSGQRRLSASSKASITDSDATASGIPSSSSGYQSDMTTTSSSTRTPTTPSDHRESSRTLARIELPSNTTRAHARTTAKREATGYAQSGSKLRTMSQDRVSANARPNKLSLAPTKTDLLQGKRGPIVEHPGPSNSDHKLSSAVTATGARVNAVMLASPTSSASTEQQTVTVKPTRGKAAPHSIPVGVCTPNPGSRSASQATPVTQTVSNSQRKQQPVGSQLKPPVKVCAASNVRATPESMPIVTSTANACSVDNMVKRPEANLVAARAQIITVQDAVQPTPDLACGTGGGNGGSLPTQSAQCLGANAQPAESSQSTANTNAHHHKKPCSETAANNNYDKHVISRPNDLNKTTGVVTPFLKSHVSGVSEQKATVGNAANHAESVDTFKASENANATQKPLANPTTRDANNVVNQPNRNTVEKESVSIRQQQLPNNLDATKIVPASGGQNASSSAIVVDTVVNSHGKKETTFDANDSDAKPASSMNEESDTLMDIKPMPPVNARTPYDGFGTARHTRAYSSLTKVTARTYLDSLHYLRVGNNQPKVSTDSNGAVFNSNDVAAADTMSGYLSDGDMLKTTHKGEADRSGYISEGGISHYHTRLQQRFREGMQAVQESMQKANRLLNDDDSLDSASVSSGDISDTFDHSPAGRRNSENSRTQLWVSDDKKMRTNFSVPVQNAGEEMETPYNISSFLNSSSRSVKSRDYPDLTTNVYTSSTLERARRKNLLNDSGHSQTSTFRPLPVSPNDQFLSHTLDRKRTSTSNGENSDFICSRNSLQMNFDNLSSNLFRQQPTNLSPSNNPHIYGLSSEPTSPWISRDGKTRLPLQSLSEAESMESLRSIGGTSYIKSQIERARASAKLTKQLLSNQSALDPDDLNNLKLLNDHLLTQNNEQVADVLNGQLSLSGIIAMSTLSSSRKDDDAHSSSLSLASSSSLYSSAEERHNSEIRRLRRELEAAQEKVVTLSTQLSTNGHMVAAFEQSLANMTNRLQKLTLASEMKDSELQGLKNTIDVLRKHHHQAEANEKSQRRLSSGSMSSMSSTCSTTSSPATPGFPASGTFADSESAGNTPSGKKKKKNWIRSSITKAFSGNKATSNGVYSADDSDIRHRQSQSDTEDIASTTSLPTSPRMSLPSTHSGPNPASPAELAGEQHTAGKEDGSVVALLAKLEEKEQHLTTLQLEALSATHQLEQYRNAISHLKDDMAAMRQENERLQKLVTAKSSLNSSESFSSSSHGSNMSAESSSGGAVNGATAAHDLDNGSAGSLTRRLSLDEPRSLDYVCPGSPDKDSTRTIISVLHNSPSANQSESPLLLTPIGSVLVTSITQWDMLDSLVKRIFKEYVYRVDSITNLGLTAESVVEYSIGDIHRSADASTPELLPYAYLVGAGHQINLTLYGVNPTTSTTSVDMLAFETLVSKPLLSRYVSLLLEHRRLIFCGPSGTGKSFLANKLAQYMVLRTSREITPGSIASFNVTSKSADALSEYLSSIAEMCDSSSSLQSRSSPSRGAKYPDVMPTVVILENLHQVSSLADVFNGFLGCKHSDGPYIISTMNQSTCSSTNLQLHHNFRWVSFANHLEPIKGLLSRFLRRRLITLEVKNQRQHQPILTKIVDWLPQVWQHVNRFIEMHNCPEITIGPRAFMQCPLETTATVKDWFIDLWNHLLRPYMIAAAKEGLKNHGRRAPFQDPTDWVSQSLPWQKDDASPVHSNEPTPLSNIRPEDIGYDSNCVTPDSADSAKQRDPLLTMLAKLQDIRETASSPTMDSNEL